MEGTPGDEREPSYYELRREFAGKRTHSDASSVNDHWKNIFNTSILLNVAVAGSVLTALYAFAKGDSRGMSSSEVQIFAKFNVAGLLMLFISVVLVVTSSVLHALSIKDFMVHWEHVFYDPKVKETSWWGVAINYVFIRDRLVIAAIAFFIMGGVSIAIGVYNPLFGYDHRSG